MANIIIREYNPSTGAFITNTSSLSFGRIVAGTHSPIKVIDFSFTGVTSISNVKLGLVSTGGIDVNDGSTGTVYADGSAELGNLGIQHDTAFNPTYGAGPATKHFPGLNDGSNSNLNTVNIGTRNDTTSQFAYLDVALGADNLGSGAGLYKIFFDFVPL